MIKKETHCICDLCGKLAPLRADGTTTSRDDCAAYHLMLSDVSCIRYNPSDYCKHADLCTKCYRTIEKLLQQLTRGESPYANESA